VRDGDRQAGAEEEVRHDKCRYNSQDLEEFFKPHPHTEFSYGETYSCKHNQIKVFFGKYRFGKYVSGNHGGSRLRYALSLGRDGTLKRRGAAEEVREPAVQLGPDKHHLQRLVDKKIIVVNFSLWSRQFFFPERYF